MVPIVDFANHRPYTPQTHMRPIPTQADKSDTAPIGMGEPFGITSPPSALLKCGEEMSFEYGRHSNSMLFIEYGFINEFHSEDIDKGEFAGEVNVQEIVEELFGDLGQTRAVLEHILRDEGYWGCVMAG
jgi:hypothetical protein